MNNDENIPIPKVGESVYIDTYIFVTHGIDDFYGGLCEVDLVNTDNGNVYISVKEDPGTSYNWKHLYQEQEQLKNKFGTNRGYQKPDLRKEFNEQ